ncbi:hypothetical protein E2C01_079215 [Portunus trituberculatus]|uniref:Uncharacterized protein n=1 Tax=Portunus trituberculatus TaxID=210409 RepID=A0A5B7IS53_PORTR|nr:hypothetical protein [Portunus trituberculatus]
MQGTEGPYFSFQRHNRNLLSAAKTRTALRTGRHRDNFDERSVTSEGSEVHTRKNQTDSLRQPGLAGNTWYSFLRLLK